mgnify:CR=1 FL=1
MISLNETVVQPALNLAGNVMLQCIYNVQVTSKYCSYYLIVCAALVALYVVLQTGEPRVAGSILLYGSTFDKCMNMVLSLALKL